MPVPCPCKKRPPPHVSKQNKTGTDENADHGLFIAGSCAQPIGLTGHARTSQHRTDTCFRQDQGCVADFFRMDQALAQLSQSASQSTLRVGREARADGAVAGGVRPHVGDGRGSLRACGHARGLARTDQHAARPMSADDNQRPLEVAQMARHPWRRCPDPINTVSLSTEAPSGRDTQVEQY